MDPKVLTEGAKVVVVMGQDRLELSLFHALKLSEELAAAGRELMKP